jgi:hypothetical protein
MLSIFGGLIKLTQATTEQDFRHTAQADKSALLKKTVGNTNLKNIPIV